MPRETVDFVVNMTYHDVTHKAEIYELLIHELAHNVVRSMSVALMPAPHLPVADANDLRRLPPRNLLCHRP